jgi:hypothetical protein
MKNMQKNIFLMIALALAGLAGCASGLENDGAKALNADKIRSTALQFIPALEGDYLRQESAYQGSGQHYRLQPAVQISGNLKDTQTTLSKGHLRFLGAKAGEAVDTASVRFKEYDSMDGRFDLFLSPGYYAVELIPDSAVLPSQRQFISVDERKSFNFVLSPGLVYHGKVSDSNGQPMPGVNVRVLGDDAVVGSSVVQTAEDGSYQIAVGPDNKASYRIEFAAPDNKSLPRVVFSRLSALPATADATTLNVQYLPTTNTTVTGRVIDADTNAPAADVSVLFTAGTTPVPVAARRLDTMAVNDDGQAVFQTKTNGNGDFSISLPRGNWTYTLNFQAPLDRPYGGLTVSNFVFGANPPVYSLKPKQLVTGKVTTPDGNPVVRAEVLISHTLSLRDNQQTIRLYTDNLGEFQTALDRSTGIYDVTVIPLGVGEKGTLAFGRCTRSAVAVDSFAETFIVHEGELSEGYVEDESGRPIPRVAVTLTETNVGESKIPLILASSATPSDEKGRFLLVVPKESSLTGCRGGKL